MFGASEGKLRSFARDAKGNVALLFGLTLIPLLIGVGVAVDYGRALIVHERMQDAADAAGLAIGSWVGLSQADMKTKAQQFFDANYPPSALGTVGKLNVNFAGNDIKVSVSGEVPTTFMQLANINTVDVGASATIAVGMGTVEVALALDNSGSMSGSKISTLRTAALDLVDTLFASAQNATKADPIKIAVVPFAASVNVGSQYDDASWMDTGAESPTHADEQKAYGAPSTTNNFTLFSNLKDSSGSTITWDGCVEARPMPYDATDDAPTGASTKFVPMFAPDEPDNWTATTSNCTTSNKCYYSGSSNSTRRFNGAPPGSQRYNNYLPDAGDGTDATCGKTSVSIASPAVVTRASHGFVAGDQVVFHTTGSLPSGLSAGTVYYVISLGLTTNSFRVSTSKGGSAVNTSGSQSGTHSITSSWTCQSGNARCGNTVSTGAAVGQSEENAFAGKSLANTPNCKYGTSAKATVANITVGGLPGGPNFMCTTTALSPLSTDKATIKSAINAMVAQGATSVMEGAMWGWRALSPGEPFAQGRAYNTEDNQKILVLMTDGQNTYYPHNSTCNSAPSQFVKSWYDVYGYVDRGRLGTTSQNCATLTDAMDTRTSQACTNIKAAGVVVYTVAFQIPGDQAGALTLLKNCASDSDKYFAPNTNSELLSAFNAIGKDISMLRISQ